MLGQLGGKASETMCVAINVRCLCLLHAVCYIQVYFSSRRALKLERQKPIKKEEEEEFELTFQREQQQVFDGVG